MRHIFLKSLTFWQCERLPILFHSAWRKTVTRSDESSWQKAENSNRKLRNMNNFNFSVWKNNTNKEIWFKNEQCFFFFYLKYKFSLFLWANKISSVSVVISKSCYFEIKRNDSCVWIQMHTLKQMPAITEDRLQQNIYLDMYFTFFFLLLSAVNITTWCRVQLPE